MLNLTDKFKKYLLSGKRQLAAIVGVVKSFSGDEQCSLDDWQAGAQQGTPGVDFPDTTLSVALTAVGTTATVVTTDGFTVAPSGYLIIIDTTPPFNFEIVKYTGATATTFTGLVRGQAGTIPRAFDIGDLVWQLIPNITGIPDYNLSVLPKNWIQPTVAGLTPPPRVGHAMTTDGNYMYMYGGYDGVGGYLEDLWKYDIANKTWTEITITGTSPYARAWHTLEWVGGNSILVFGGTSAANGYFSTLFHINTSTGVSTKKKTFPRASGRAFHMSCYSASYMYIAGGSSSANSGAPVSATWRYSISGDSWQKMTSADYNIYQGEGVWMSNEGLFFMVARTGGNEIKALAYNPSNESGTPWEELKAPDSKRSFPAMCYDSTNSRVLMCGGEVFSDPDATHDKLYYYSKATNSWTELAAYRENVTRAKMIWDYQNNKEAIMWGGWVDTTPTWQTYDDPAKFRYYWSVAKFRTQTLDLGATPSESGEWRFEDVFEVTGNKSSITYTAEYSDDDSAWTPMGTVEDGDTITDKHRYYRVTASLYCDDIKSPYILSIDAVFDQLLKYSLADKPLFDYAPMVKNFPSPTAKMDAVKNSATISGFTVDFLNSGGLAEEIITTVFPRNKTVFIWVGFATDDLLDPFVETDFVLFFKGIISDWNFDGDTLSLKCEDFIGDLKVDVPREASGVPPTLTAIVYSDVGITNPVDIISDLLKNQIGVPDRNIDDNSFTRVKDDPTLSGWKFIRTISNPTDAYKMIIEVCRHIGAVLIPREEGKLVLELDDPTANPVASFDENSVIFRSARFRGNAANTKNFISTWYGWDGDGDAWTDYDGADLDIDSDSVTNWGREIIRTKSKWLGASGSPYDGDDRASDISARILAYAKNGIPAITLDTDLSRFAVQVNDIVRVQTGMIGTLHSYLQWMHPASLPEGRPINPRPTVPYLAYGANECVDMKFRVVRKKVNFDKGTISWELWRVRSVLSVDVDSQDDFEEGSGAFIDYDTNPGSVQIDLDAEVDINRDNLVMHLKMDEGTGEPQDTSGNLCHGLRQGGPPLGPTWELDDDNYCLDFVATDEDYVDIPNAWIEKAAQHASQTRIFSLEKLLVGTGIYELYAGTGLNGLLFRWNDVDLFTQVAAQLNGQNYIFALKEYLGKIYGGTGLGGRLFQFDKVNSLWLQKAPQLGGETRILSLESFESELYGGTGFAAGNLYKWNSVAAWISVAAQLSGQTRIYSLAVFGGELYGGTFPGGRLFQFDKVGLQWLQRTPQFGAETFIFCLKEFEGELYGGSGNGGELLKYNPGGGVWVQAAPKFGAETQILSLAEFKGDLYAGTFPNGKLLKFDKANSVFLEVAAKFGNESYIYHLEEYYDELFGGSAINGELLQWGKIEPRFDFERTDSFSLSGWFKSSSATRQMIISKRQSGAPYRGWELELHSGGSVYFSLSNTYPTNEINVYTTASGFNDGAWHHYVVTYDGSSAASGVKIYIDGAEEALTVARNSLSATILNDEIVVIGDRDHLGISTFMFNGRLDEKRVYNDELANFEDKALYDMGRKRKPPKVIYERIFDLGQQPEQDGVFTITDNIPGGTTIIYKAYASEMGLFQGEEREITEDTIADTETITQWKMRYYKMICEMTPNSAWDTTPRIDHLKIDFPNG